MSADTTRTIRGHTTDHSRTAHGLSAYAIRLIAGLSVDGLWGSREWSAGIPGIVRGHTVYSPPIIPGQPVDSPRKVRDVRWQFAHISWSVRGEQAADSQHTIREAFGTVDSPCTARVCSAESEWTVREMTTKFWETKHKTSHYDNRFIPLTIEWTGIGCLLQARRLKYTDMPCLCD